MVLFNHQRKGGKKLGLIAHSGNRQDPTNNSSVKIPRSLRQQVFKASGELGRSGKNIQFEFLDGTTTVQLDIKRPSKRTCEVSVTTSCGRERNTTITARNGESELPLRELRTQIKRLLGNRKGIQVFSPQCEEEARA